MVKAQQLCDIYRREFGLETGFICSLTIATIYVYLRSFLQQALNLNLNSSVTITS
jgi:hypothetical protein